MLVQNSGQKPAQYTNEERQLAFSIYFHSVSAYNQIRNAGGLPLPHPDTVGRWLSSVECVPGFQSDVIDLLREKARSGDAVEVGIINDGMALSVDESQDGDNRVCMDGLEDAVKLMKGANAPDEPAQHLSVCMVVGLDPGGKPWKAVVGYWALAKETGSVISSIIRSTTRVLADAGLKVRTVTLDGAKFNISAYQKLGAKLTNEHVGGDVDMIDPTLTELTDLNSGVEVLAMPDPGHVRRETVCALCHFCVVPNSSVSTTSDAEKRSQRVCRHFPPSIQSR